ncbi:MAG: hypothetical protein GY779_15265 [Gammaproteobacteria bacterium]|nr:hypothetical protein [Gammaproteobacteria bacterium]
MKKYSIGIDPGKNTGFALYGIPEAKLLIVDSMDFWRVYNAVLRYKTNDLSRVVVEVPATKHVWHKDAANTKAMQRQAVNVGGVIREAELMADGLEYLGYPVVRVHPRGKVDRERFIKYTGWTDRCNEHARDAAMLCYGR